MTRIPVNRFILLSCAVFLFFAGSLPAFAAFSSLFTTSDECTFCHTSSFSALVDSQGNDLSIADDWNPTMMGNSFRDPLFRAKFESEIVRNPQLAETIEDKCLTCHAPMARTQAKRDGAVTYSLSEAENSVFAQDGVSCSLCHQIQKDGLGDPSSFSGNYAISDERKIFGPYTQVFPNPMLNHVDYLPMYGEQVDKPEFCATCHTLFTPIVADDGKIAGNFPEQTPYLEWSNSIYAAPESYLSCQDCHMPRIDEPVKISNRPPWFQEKQSPFWKHHFIGGNTLILRLLKDNRHRLGSPVPNPLYAKALKRTEKRLSREAAAIEIVKVEQKNSRLHIDVRVTNNTGHKFPTGFPSRRAWLYLTVTDQQKQIIFTSGEYTPQGKIVGVDSTYEPHHLVINSPEQVQIYQSIMGDVSGNHTSTLLNAASYLKDNRLPPRGYKQSGKMASFTQIAGKAATDMNFNAIDDQEGTGADIVSYDIPIMEARYPLAVKAQLLYQSSSPRFLDDLLQDDTPAISQFKEMYAHEANIPVVIDVASYNLVR